MVSVSSPVPEPFPRVEQPPHLCPECGYETTFPNSLGLCWGCWMANLKTINRPIPETSGELIGLNAEHGRPLEASWVSFIGPGDEIAEQWAGFWVDGLGAQVKGESRWPWLLQIPRESGNLWGIVRWRIWQPGSAAFLQLNWTPTDDHRIQITPYNLYRATSDERLKLLNLQKRLTLVEQRRGPGQPRMEDVPDHPNREIARKAQKLLAERRPMPFVADIVGKSRSQLYEILARYPEE